MTIYVPTDEEREAHDREFPGLAAWLPEPGAPCPQWYLDMAPAIHRASGFVLRLLRNNGYDGGGFQRWRARKRLRSLPIWRSFRTRRGAA